MKIVFILGILLLVLIPSYSGLLLKKYDDWNDDWNDDNYDAYEDNTHHYNYNHDRILLQDVHVLTFKNGQRTIDNYSSTMKCKGFYCLDTLPDCYVDSVQCTNKGLSQNHDVNWKCEAVVINYNNNFDCIVRDFQVTCKGYDYPTDPYILRDSCSITYTLDKNRNYPSDHTTRTYYISESDDLILFVLTVCVLIGIIIWIISSMRLRRTIYVNDRVKYVYPWHLDYYKRNVTIVHQYDLPCPSSRYYDRFRKTNTTVQTRFSTTERR